MGFFGSLFGFDQSMGAVNTVLASHLIEKANRSDRKRIASEVFNIITSVRRGQPLDTILTEISKETRVVQMNFIALACDNLGIAPPVRNNVWTRVENPYRIGNQVDAQHISIAVDVIAKQDGVRIAWPGNDSRIDFKKMHAEGALR
jgi:hypothetical protein